MDSFDISSLILLIVIIVVVVASIAITVAIYKKTKYKIINSSDVEKDTDLLLRSFWTSLIIGPIIGFFITLRYCELIEEHWNEYQELNKKIWLGFWLSVLATIFVVPIIVGILGILLMFVMMILLPPSRRDMPGFEQTVEFRGSYFASLECDPKSGLV